MASRTLHLERSPIPLALQAAELEEPSVAGVLNQLGQEGWELAGVSNTKSPLIYRMLLKQRASGSGA